MKLEVVPVPVADVERAQAFYVEKIGFHLDYDTRLSATVRFMQLTPPGSACSILIGTGLEQFAHTQPGAVRGLVLVVRDVSVMWATLMSRGVAVDDIIEYPRGIKAADFRDPDGNSWTLQEIPPNF